MSFSSQAAGLADAQAELIKETTSAGFRKDVIAESALAPVLVDFWAPWCGPCRQLTPVLEKVVLGAKGAVKLVKMNIDSHPQIADQLGIKSIPAVIAFQNGQPVDGFMGALPESQILAFLERLIGPSANDDADLLRAAEEARGQGDLAAAIETYRQILSKNPAQLPALAGLIGVYVESGAIEQARALLGSLDSQMLGSPEISGARSALELAERAAAVGDMSDLRRRVAADPSDQEARLDLAVALNSQGERGEAAAQLLEALRRDRHWKDDATRKQLLQFFAAWGPTDPETISARRQLSALLFS